MLAANALLVKLMYVSLLSTLRGTKHFGHSSVLIGGMKHFGVFLAQVGGTKHFTDFPGNGGMKHFQDATLRVRNILNFSHRGYETFHARFWKTLQPGMQVKK